MWKGPAEGIKEFYRTTNYPRSKTGADLHIQCCPARCMMDLTRVYHAGTRKKTCATMRLTAAEREVIYGGNGILFGVGGAKDLLSKVVVQEESVYPIETELVLKKLYSG